eukprot:CAMPEP_0194302404 /NCGR_PEP_ID=MMETSP0171-20130528/129_1 /TAXON_ID=218684 /ORGANISM="Corethron pennatum, Strain L29A3" /LENGTH=53 /DNA_ID=CAMNT_0039052763 /DNA_START=137 /DNA_END=295 /DNA_ORIENTATION=+
MKKVTILMPIPIGIAFDVTGGDTVLGTGVADVTKVAGAGVGEEVVGDDVTKVV